MTITTVNLGVEEMYPGHTVKKTFVSSEEHHYIVSSAYKESDPYLYQTLRGPQDPLLDETYVFECDENMAITNWAEVWGVRPRDHEGVVRYVIGRLTEGNPFPSPEKINFDDFDLDWEDIASEPAEDVAFEDLE